MAGKKNDKMDAEYMAMRRRMSRLRVKCGKHSSLEGKLFSTVILPLFLPRRSCSVWFVSIPDLCLPLYLIGFFFVK